MVSNVITEEEFKAKVDRHVELSTFIKDGLNSMAFGGLSRLQYKQCNEAVKKYQAEAEGIIKDLASVTKIVKGA